MTTRILPYGAWPSAITTEALTRGAKGFGQLGLHAPASGIAPLYWLESRPQEGGRTTIVRRTAAGQEETLLHAPWNARSRVHEYGGTAVVAVGEVFYFVNFRDQGLYRVVPGEEPALVSTAPGRRLADLVVDAPRNRLLAVAEQHPPAAPEGDQREDAQREDAQQGNPGAAVENFIIALPLDGAPAVRLIDGHDFFAAPRLSPDGGQLAWLAWDHPNMPWDAAALYVATIDAAGRPGPPVHVAGNDSEAIFQPEWTAAGDLIFIGEQGGWWNPSRWRGGVAQPICADAAEYGLPLWGLGSRAYTIIDNDTLLCQRLRAGAAELVRVRISDGACDVMATGWQRFHQLCNDGQRLWYTGERHDRPAAIIERDLATGAETVVATSGDTDLNVTMSAPQRIQFPTAGGATAYGYFYAPAHANCTGPEGTLPPLLVTTHGGPTGAASPALSLRVQYFTSRGWAVVDVDYRGSTGYGRAYRDSLKGQWGIADVEDCVAAVDHLAARGLIDADRVAIRGGSAGGYTTLAALVFTQRFRAGVSYYGIGDLAALARDTHKFESHYTDLLVAPWPAGEAIYAQRSPINFLDQFKCPAIFFQGALDRIVPPNQAEAMVAALRRRGIAVAHVVFDDEGHGFRNGTNIRTAMAAEYYFLAKVFGFTPADQLPAIPIDNLLES